MKNVGIISSNKWKDKLFEDNAIRDELIKRGITSSIISWEEENDYSKYDLLILRSVWGYQDKYEEFKNWLINLKNNNIKILNDVDLILNNIRKDKQFEILKRNNIPLIETEFISDIKDTNYYIDYVIKPSISGSGNNTYLVMDKLSESQINTYKSLLQNKDLKLMIQPFINEIKNGEYAIIFIDGKITHTMMRFPGVLHDSKRPYYEANIPSSVVKLASDVASISDYKNHLYMRVDIVISNDKALVMEVELAEPDLLTKYIEDKNIQKSVIENICDAIERRM